MTLLWKGKRREISGGFLKTTNNRMEIMAIVEGLRALTGPCRVVVHSDSRYVVDAMTKGWITNWQRRNWIKSNREAVKNIDLWKRLIEAAAPHEVSYKWLRGHVGHRENERCDVLAKAAAARDDRPADDGFEEASSGAPELF